MESGQISSDHCLTMLKNARSDNEKFAALMVMTKVVKAGSCDELARSQLAEAIGFSFLTRLLQTETSPEGCSDSVFPALALSVLSAFSQDEAVVKNPEFMNKVPYFCTTISSGHSDGDSEATRREMVDDSYQCLEGLALYSVTSLRQPSVVSSLVHSVTSRLYGCEKAFRLLVHLVEKCGPQTWADNSIDLKTLMDMLVGEFKNEQTQKKFEWCSQLSHLLPGLPKDCPRPWLPQLIQAIRLVLQSKIGEDQREPTLHLVSTVCNVMGIQSFLPPHTENCTTFLLVTQLVAVEVRMITEVEDFHQVSSKESLLSACFTCLEQVISYLSEDTSTCLDSKQKGQLHSALVAAFNGIIFFLSYVDREKREKMTKLVVVGSVRVLGAWLAEETAALRTEVYRVLPFLVALSKATFPSVKGGHDEVCTLQFLLPGLCHLTAEDEPRAILIGQQLHVLVAQYFSHLMGDFTARPRQQTEMSLRTLCGVLLNLTVLETDLVKSHPVFTEIFTLLTDNLPFLLSGSSNFVLIANQVTLGLMIGRHPEIKQTVTGDRLRMFFSSVIAYLKMVHNSSQSELIVSPSFQAVWEDVAELWFLAIQALGACIPVHEEVCQEILASDWLPRLMRQVIGTSASDSREDYVTLLCHLARGHRNVKEVIVQGGGIQLASLPGGEELKKALSSG